MLLIRNKSLRLLGGLMESLSWLAIKLWIKNPKQAKGFSGQVFREYMSRAGRGRWVCRGIEEILGETWAHQIVLEPMRGEGISTPIDELAYMAMITRHLAAERIFEIGTFRGRTALNFALNSPEHCQVYTLDLPPDDRASVKAATNLHDAAIIEKSETGIDYRGKPAAAKIRQLLGNSMTFDFSPYYGRMDLVFIDGAHHYGAVKHDTEEALRMVREGGLILWHDFANYGDYNDVLRAALDLLPGDEVIQIGSTQLAFYRKPVSSGGGRGE